MIAIMEKIYNILLIMIYGLIFTACQNDEGILQDQAVGYLRLEVGADKTTITKAEEAYNPKQIAVKIIDETGKTVKETDDYTIWTDAIALTPGKYKISASSAGFDGTTAAWDKPYYAGLDSVTIVKGESVSKTVTCTLANVLVTVEFDSEFKKAFRSATVVVTDTVTASNKVTFTMNETTEKGKAYFPVTGLFADLAVTNQKDKIFSKKDTVEDVKARENVILRYKLGESSTGSTNIDITLDGTTKTYIYTIGVPLTATSTIVASEANAWSSFVYLNAEIPSFAGIFDSSKLSFEYKTAEASEWIKVETEKTVIEKDKKYSIKLSDLAPGTAYQYRVFYDDGTEKGIESNVVDFVTEIKAQLPNSNFDEWFQKGSTWYAISSDDNSKATSDSNGMLFSFWDSGNPGTSSFKDANPTVKEETDVNTLGGKSAKLSSQFVGVSFLNMGKFAAGNIYTGHFCSANTDTYQAKINFGQPFTSRPTQLKGWFKYNRGTNVDYPKNDGEYKNILQSAGGDLCSVYIALVDNEGFTYDGKKFAYEINGDLSGDDPDNFKYKNAIDFSENNKHIIAYGTLSDEEAKGTGEWQEFTIDLKYRDITRIPKYIIVVASASKYGDYFTGSTSSVMYIDDFELIYGDEPVLSE